MALPSINQTTIQKALITIGVVLIGLYVISHYTDQGICDNFGLVSHKTA